MGKLRGAIVAVLAAMATLAVPAVASAYTHTAYTDNADMATRLDGQANVSSVHCFGISTYNMKCSFNYGTPGVAHATWLNFQGEYYYGECGHGGMDFFTSPPPPYVSFAVVNCQADGSAFSYGAWQEYAKN